MSNIYVLLYCDGASDLANLTTQQKTDLVLKYTPADVQASTSWKALNAAGKWTYFIDNVVPGSYKDRLARMKVLPSLIGIDNKFEIIDQYWVLAQSGTKYVFLFYLDTDNLLPRIKTWLDAQQTAGNVRYWYGSSMVGVIKDLWQDRANAIALAVGKKIIKYPVEDTVDGVQVTRFVPMK